MIKNFLSIEFLEDLILKTKTNKKLTLTGVSGSFSAVITGALQHYLNAGILIITKDELRARELSEDLQFLAETESTQFPAREPVYFDIEGAGTEFMHKRLKILSTLAGNNKNIIITGIEALQLKLPSKDDFLKNSIVLKTGDSKDIDILTEKLIQNGYIRTDKVSLCGEFARRGSILDVYPVNSDIPVRIDFFGDEIDALKSFDPVSQRSMENIGECHIIQSLEYSLSKSDRQRIADRLKSYKTDDLQKDIERFENNIYFPSMDKYLDIIYNKPSTLIDYLPKDTLIIIEDRKSIEETVRVKEEEYSGPKDIHKPLMDINEIYRSINKFKNIDFTALDEPGTAGSRTETLEYRIKRPGDFSRNKPLFINTLKDLKKEKYRIIILTTGISHANRLVHELGAEGLESGFTEVFKRPVEKGGIAVINGMIHESLLIPSMKLVIITESIFIPRKNKRIKKHLSKESKIEVFTDLRQGDLVVHYSHGIGIYEGIVSLNVENIKKDYLKISYRGDDFIYIPVNQVDLISKYIGSDGRKPKLSKLGGTEWNNAKSRVKKALRDIAKDLLEIYSKREKIKGFRFSEDREWQKEFEEDFPYEETVDQIRSIEEIKKDMESEKPMDRLLCGDVGYGKTEVALRAVFKAAMDGKQTAFLVPTTILAQQHFQTFTERLRKYPISVEVLSRFRSRKSQQRILQNAEKGKLDVLIGTHRLLSKDIKFKNLGLLIVDEEQRFGVEHKERIKALFPEIDVLTLSATPIPRTLHMSLSGIRDISIIEKPPEERYPVQTYVFEYNDEIIRTAIRRELGRGGQVFYLSNRVRNIETKCAKIRKLIGSGVTLGIAHGQMSTAALEGTLKDFIQGEFSILVCTTIIESGIDMPNVNTIIVEDADRMGLAQLYQLRGRVGRSNRQAYAYITTKKGKAVTENAEKRLSAIREFTEFGAGFKIAMRDMEIRGAGNLLGAQQHGQLEKVGYDMYCKLLNEAVMELKGEFHKRNTVETLVDLRINAYIPDKYINIEHQKIDIYKKIALISDDDDFLEIEDELMDRFGEIPQETYNIMKIAYIKNIASRFGIINITERTDGYILEFSKEIGIEMELFKNLHEKYGKSILINMGMKPHLFLKSKTNSAESIDNIKFLLREINSFEKQDTNKV
jgi:transcription-repair coupling factor (superfamily II helicase)